MSANVLELWEIIERLDKKDARIKELEGEYAEALSVTKETARIAIKQAGEWDRFWLAMDVLSAEITVDDAIAKWKAMRDERDTLRAAHLAMGLQVDEAKE